MAGRRWEAEGEERHHGSVRGQGKHAAPTGGIAAGRQNQNQGCPEFIGKVDFAVRVFTRVSGNPANGRDGIICRDKAAIRHAAREALAAAC
jgi:hypothetical protein